MFLRDVEGQMFADLALTIAIGVTVSLLVAITILPTAARYWLKKLPAQAVQHELWLCLGEHGGERGLDALEVEISTENRNSLGRRAAAYGLARAGETKRLEEFLQAESDGDVRKVMEDALSGNTGSAVFGKLQPEN